MPTGLIEFKGDQIKNFNTHHWVYGKKCSVCGVGIDRVGEITCRDELFRQMKAKSDKYDRLVVELESFLEKIIELI